MGLLKRKQQQPIQILQSKNPTGLPTTKLTDSKNATMNSSLIAAKAAAALSRGSAIDSKPPTPKLPMPPPRPINASRTQLRKGTRSRPVSMNLSSPELAPHHTISKSYEPSSISLTKPMNTTKSHIRKISQSRPLSMSFSSLDSESNLRASQSYDSINNHFPNLTITERMDPPPRSLNQSPSLNVLSTQTVSAASASKNSLLSQELQPPNFNQNTNFYSSSGSSAISSSHSLDLLRVSSRERSRNLDQSLKIVNESTGSFVSSSNESSESLLDGLKEHDYQMSRSKESIVSDLNSDVPFPVDDFYNERCLDDVVTSPEVEDCIDSELSTRQNSIHSDTFTLEPPPSLPTRIRIVPPGRKPPPITPGANYTYSQPDLFDYAFKQRSTSPKRKPPPGEFSDPDTFTSVIDEETEQKPRLNYYELTRNKSYQVPHKRNGFKSLIKKGLKTTGTVTNLNKKETSLVEKPVQLRSTLRKEKKTDKFNEEKPWKHHQDTQYITESERKRYEGVWVTNKGLYMSIVDPDTIQKTEEDNGYKAALKASRMSTHNDVYLKEFEDQLMLNLVVRELWSRSKLPQDQLRQIWDLVDSRKDGTLDKRSFIVGMWFVDQCLYGRKLPKFVDETVWNSVSNIGVNVIIRPKRKK